MDDVEALSTIVSILRNLDDDTQKRVLASVEAFLGVKAQSHTGLRKYQGLLDAPVEIGSGSSFSEDRTISPKDFIKDKQPASDAERVACLGYYLSHYRSTTHFKTVDISSLNVEAAQPKFSNASVAVDNARARGFLVASTKGNKQMSAFGESYVELLPDRDAAKASMTKIKPRRILRKAKVKQGR